MRLCVQTNAIGFNAFSYCAIRSVPTVGNIANNVRPLMRRTRNKPSGLGTAMPILEWANAIGNQWVNDTVRSYRQGAK